MKRRYGQFRNAARMANFKSDEEHRSYSVIADPVRRAGFMIVPESQREPHCKALFTVNAKTIQPRAEKKGKAMRQSNDMKEALAEIDPILRLLNVVELLHPLPLSDTRHGFVDIPRLITDAYAVYNPMRIETKHRLSSDVNQTA